MSRKACCQKPDGPLLTSHRRILNRPEKTCSICVLWCVSVATTVVVARAVAAFSSLAGCRILISCAQCCRTGGLGAVPATGSWVSGRAPSYRSAPARHSRYYPRCCTNCPRPLSPGGEAPCLPARPLSVLATWG